MKVTEDDNMDNGQPSERDRVEIKHHLNQGDDTEFYYSWNVLIPKDNNNHLFDFPDNPVLDENQSNFHLIAQFIQATNDGERCPQAQGHAQPIFKLNYVHEDHPDPNDLERDLVVQYGLYGMVDHNETPCYPNDESRYHTFRINNAIEKGKWFNVIVKFKWRRHEYGYMQMWIDNKPVILDPNDNNKEILGNVGDDAFKYMSRNVFSRVSNGDVVENNIKLGHYRSTYHTGSSTLYVDDVRISTSFPPEKDVTQIIQEECGIMYPEDYIFHCYSVGGANKYRFKFTKGTETPLIFETNLPQIDLNTLSGLTSNSTYSVEVCGVIDAGTFAEYQFRFGPPCSITIPRYTKLKSADCGVSLTADNMVIEAYPIIGASSYKFKFINGSDNKIYVSDDPILDLSTVGGTWLSANTTYTVLVRAVIDENTSYAYGDACTITTPRFTKLKPAFCNANITFENDVLEAYPIFNASLYRFKFDDGNDVRYYNRTLPEIDLSEIAWLQEFTGYSVQVRAVIDETTSYSYGDVCEIFYLGNFFGLAKQKPIEINDAMISPETVNKETQAPTSGPDSKTGTNTYAIYPNPSRKELTISSVNDDDKILTIYSITGTELYQTSFKLKLTLDLDEIDLSKGIYLFSILENHQLTNYRVIRE